MWVINVKGQGWKVNCRQLYDLSKSWSEADDMLDPVWDTDISCYQLASKLAIPNHTHPYGTHSKTNAASTSIEAMYLYHGPWYQCKCQF